MKAKKGTRYISKKARGQKRSMVFKRWNKDMEKDQMTEIYFVD